MPEHPSKPFWKTRTLAELTTQEWESLCDGCGRCCLQKLEDEASGEIHFTNIACHLLDPLDCVCTNYPKRSQLVADCMTLNADLIATTHWLPKTCAYRIIAEGGDLAWWHPLVSGSCETVHTAGISVRDKTIPETNLGVEDFENHIVDWIE